MALRCLLVGLVASLGFDLPSNRDLTSWKVMGRDWFAARAVDLSAVGAEASGWLGATDPTLSPTVPLAATDAASATVPNPTDADELIRRRDQTFDAVGGEMAAALAADQRQLAETTPVPTPASIAEAASIAVAAVAPGESLCRPEALADDLAFPVPDAAAVADEGAEADEPAAPSAPAGRLTSAVRLTRDAVQAWASLVQAMGGEVLVR